MKQGFDEDGRAFLKGALDKFLEGYRDALEFCNYDEPTAMNMFANHVRDITRRDGKMMTDSEWIAVLTYAVHHIHRMETNTASVVFSAN